ncbi:hypothetical protein IMSAG044_01732 [Lactobacillaceae bacterium]|nr:hypothetical protein IMSAG044_01732 [Lactobacillaceae bacterium]
MKFKLKKFIEESSDRNSDGIYDKNSVRGISIDKVFIKTKANLSGVNLKNYILVPPSFFAYTPVTSRNGNKLSIAFNDTDKTLLVSAISTVFYVKETEKLLPNFLNLMFKRREFDRYARFNSWGSARETFDFNELCDTEVNIPDISIQKSLAKVYSQIKKNIEVYKMGDSDISIVIESSIDKLKNSSIKIPVGELMSNVDTRNVNNSYNNVLGINIRKEFIPSHSKSAKLSNYKVIKKNQFAYNSMQTGRDNCIRIALYRKEEAAIVSPSYSVLEVTSNKVLPEYIQMWFSRNESDRRGAFMTDGSIRSNLDLQRFFETEIPVPSLKKQQALVNLFLVKQERNQIVKALEKEFLDICPILFKGANI